MASALGQGLVLLGLLACALGVPVGFYSGAARSPQALEWTRRLTLVFAASMTAATAVMVWALLSHDFSVSYVAQVGSLATPTHITIVSLWSSLEGSILFWGFVLGGFAAATAVLQRTGHSDYLGYTLATVLVVGTFFCFLIAGPANPFRPTPLPIPTDGPGPNPLLQNHILMIVHPPTALPRLRRHDDPLRHGRGGAVARPARRDVAATPACLAAGAHGVSHRRHHARRLVVLRGPRLGRLLGLGSGRERLVPALVDRYRRRALGSRAGAPRAPSRPGR